MYQRFQTGELGQDTPRARRVAWLAFSGSRSRAGFPVCFCFRFNTVCSVRRRGQPRMEPAPASPTTHLRDNLSAPPVARQHHCGAGGLGVRAQAPFAVATDTACVTALTQWQASSATSARERGSENGCPDHLPCLHFRAQHLTSQSGFHATPSHHPTTHIADIANHEPIISHYHLPERLLPLT